MLLPFRLTAVGVGPGDPELITLKGLRAIQAADLIFLPAAESGDNAILGVVRRLIDEEWQRVVELSHPTTLEANKLKAAWSKVVKEVNRNFKATAEEQPHRRELQGVYLFAEDPLLYGAFSYLQQELGKNYPDIKVEVVPGVTAFSAATAIAKLPVTTTAQIAVLPANQALDTQQLRHWLAEFETVILLDVGPLLPEILVLLKEMRLLDAARLVTHIGGPNAAVISDLRQWEAQRSIAQSLLIVRHKII